MTDSYDQMTLEPFARSKDPAMANAVETPTVIAPAGECDVTQRTEARSHRRNYVPAKKGKAHDDSKDSSLSDAGDSRREKGRTQEFLVVHL